MSEALTVAKPMLFSGPMVRAILDGRKTQTRRIVKFKGPAGHNHNGYNTVTDRFIVRVPWTPEKLQAIVTCPHPVGSRIWVRETHCIESNFNLESEETYPPPFKDGRPVKRTSCDVYGNYWEQCHYKATDPQPELVTDSDEPGCKWSPSIHMPRWASRITLEVTDVRVQRLQEINGMDAKAEGVSIPAHIPHDGADLDWARREFQAIWIAINGAGSWEANPWVWAYTFKAEPARGGCEDE